MSRIGSSLFLRRVLLADGVLSGATGLMAALGAEALQRRSGVPAAVVREAGWSLVPFAILAITVARREAPPRAGVLAVIGLNVAWVAASVLLVLLPAARPNGPGIAFVLGQAAAVAVVAELEYVGLRGSSALAV